MRVLFTLLISPLFLFSIHAQKCSYISNTVSGMDGSRQIITEPITIKEEGDPGKLIVWSKLHLDTSIVVAFTIENYGGADLNDLDRIMMNLKDGSELTLALMNKISLRKQENTKYTLYAVLDDNELSILTQTNVSSLYLVSEEKTVNFLPDRKGTGAVKKVVSCVEKARK